MVLQVRPGAGCKATSLRGKVEKEREEKKVVTIGEQPSDLRPYDEAQAAPQAILRGIEKSLPCTQQMLNGCLEA